MKFAYSKGENQNEIDKRNQQAKWMPNDTWNNQIGNSQRGMMTVFGNGSVHWLKNGFQGEWKKIKAI